MSGPLKLKARGRQVAERLLRAQAKPVRRLLLATGRDHTACGKLAALAAAEVIQHIGARPAVSLKGLAQENGLL